MRNYTLTLRTEAPVFVGSGETIGKKEYLFLMAEFDNFRKRTLRERTELIKSAAEKALKGILPVVDDFERGLDAIKDTSDAEAVKEGMRLIYNKFVKYLADNGVKDMQSTGADFDPDMHEAVAMVPAENDAEKGKVKDTVLKGYMLNDKVLRHAKSRCCPISHPVTL